MATGSEPTFMRIKLHVCDTCTASNYLTITRCENTVDHKGNHKLEEKDIVTNLAVDDTEVELIRAAILIAPIPGMPPLGPPLAEPGADALAAVPAGTGAEKAPGTNWTMQS